MLKLMDLKEQGKKNTLLLPKEKQVGMINIILINFLLFITFISCTKEQPSNTEIPQNSKMSQSVNTQINAFTERPFYQIKIKTSGVNYDILINDFSVFSFYGNSGGTNSEYPINTGILASGKQSLTVKVYPIKGADKILPSNSFSLVINKKKDAWIFDNQREIVLTMPTMIVPESGLPYWEYKAEFDAVVPYNLQGWKNSSKLEDENNLQSRLMTAYNNLKTAIETKNNEEFIKLTKNKVDQEAISLYEKQEENANGFQAEKETVLPFDHCTMKFYGNGKLVRLEAEDGQPCLRSELIIDGKKEIYYYPVFFHLPKDRNELEVIR